MTSSNSYKIWLWDSGASQFREITSFTDFSWTVMLNGGGSFSATAYATDSNIQDLLKADTPFRITDTGSTDGTCESTLLEESTGETGAASGSHIIMEGFLSKPTAQEKGRRNDKPVVWDISGKAIFHETAQLQYDGETDFTNENSGDIFDSASGNLIGNAGSNLNAGTIDSGESGTSLRVRDDNLLAMAMDIASLGDSTDDFTYYINVDATDGASGDFTPELDYLSSTNALFETSDPTGGADSARVISEKTDARSVEVQDERDRIVNKCKVRFAGIGSGSQSSATSFASDSSSVATHGEQQRILYEPWVQDSDTATNLRDTIVNMFKGGTAGSKTNASGIVRARVVMANGDMFTSDFDAVLGDEVAVTRSGGTTVTGRFLKATYEQMREALVVDIGLPALPLGSISNVQRKQRQAYSSMKETTPLQSHTHPIPSLTVESHDHSIPALSVSSHDHDQVSTGTSGSTTTEQVGQNAVNSTQPASSTGNVADQGTLSVTLNFTDNTFNPTADDMIYYFMQVGNASSGTNYDWELAEEGGTRLASQDATMRDRNQSWPVLIPAEVMIDFGGTGTQNSATFEIKNFSGGTESFNIQLSAWVIPEHSHSSGTLSTDPSTTGATSPSTQTDTTGSNTASTSSDDTDATTPPAHEI